MEASLAPKAQKTLRNWLFWRMDFSVCSHLLFNVEVIMLSLAFAQTFPGGSSVLRLLIIPDVGKCVVSYGCIIVGSSKVFGPHWTLSPDLLNLVRSVEDCIVIFERVLTSLARPSAAPKFLNY
jgi:hypothetical protein